MGDPTKKRYYRRRPKKSLNAVVRKAVQNMAETKVKVLAGASNVAVSTTAAISASLTVDQGIDQDQRIGNEIAMTGFRIEGCVRRNPANTTPDIVRAIVAIRKRGYDATPPAGLALNNELDLDAWTILYDKLLDVSPGYGTKRFVISKKFANAGRRGLIQRYNGTGGSALVTNCIQLYLVSDNAGASQPGVTYHGRMYFKDI